MARSGLLLLSVLAMAMLAGSARAADASCILDLMAAETTCEETPRNATTCPAPCAAALTALPQDCQNYVIQNAASIAATLNVTLST